MAGTLMHLVLADQLLDKIDTIGDPQLFYCGNLAPDAIMARKNYDRSMKRHTHFKDDIHLHELAREENFSLYRQRFQGFIDTFLHKEKPLYDLFLGYVTHMLIDELYILELRDRHVERLLEMGLDPLDKPYFDKFTLDVDQYDYELVRSYTFKYPMPETFLSRSDYEIPGYITREEIIDSKNFVYHKYFEEKPEKRPLLVMTTEENDAFIRLCVEKVPLLLEERTRHLGSKRK